MPVGTLVVNVTGCLALGLLTGVGLGKVPEAVLGTGVCGAYTTFSTFSYETVRLAEERALRPAALHVAASLGLGLLAVLGGLALGRAL